MVVSVKETFQTLQTRAIASQLFLPYLALVISGQKSDNQLKISIEKQFGSREKELSDRKGNDENIRPIHKNQNVGASLDQRKALNT